jgi:xanthine dehydrogenase accessory factor
MKENIPRVLIRGGGDLATGVALRLHRCGFPIVVTEIHQPRAVRRSVAFAQAVYSGEIMVGGATARLASEPNEALALIELGEIPVLIDPAADSRHVLQPMIIVDGRMQKEPPEIGKEAAAIVIGLGPGFIAGVHCHATVETNRGHDMGRVIWDGAAQADTGIPEAVIGHDADRVIRSPLQGEFQAVAKICNLVEPGEILARVDDHEIKAAFAGVVRGLLQSGLLVEKNEKVGDLDPRANVSLCQKVSDKSLAVGGGVLETLLSYPEVRAGLGLCGEPS